MKIYFWIVVVGLALLALYKVSEWRADAHKLAAEIASHEADNKACAENKLFTKDSSHEIDTKLDDIDDYALSLLEGTAKLPATSSSKQHDVATCPDQSARLTINQRRLNDKQAAQLVSCQNTIRFIYKQNGQENLLPGEIK